MTSITMNKITVMPKRPAVPSVVATVMNSDSVEDLGSIEALWFDGYGVDPASAVNRYEVDLVRTAARADWLYKRADRTYAEVEAQTHAASPDPMLWNEAQHRTLARFLRYRTVHAVVLGRHRRALETYRKSRADEFAQIQKLHLAMEQFSELRLGE